MNVQGEGSRVEQRGDTSRREYFVVVGSLEISRGEHLSVWNECLAVDFEKYTPLPLRGSPPAMTQFPRRPYGSPP